MLQKLYEACNDLPKEARTYLDTSTVYRTRFDDGYYLGKAHAAEKIMKIIKKLENGAKP